MNNYNVLIKLALVVVVAGRAVPTPEQLQWGGKFGSIIHYEISTPAKTQGCNRSNWLKSNNPLQFNPPFIDSDSWLAAISAAGIDYAVYTAKHNCGFTMWPTKTTLPDGSPYNFSIQYSSCPTCDAVASFLASCKKYNVKPGFYYSISENTFLNVDKLVVGPGPLLPGQANVTQQQFYDIALAQLEELWGNYGQDNLFEIWFDGGLPSDPSFSARLIALKNKYQPSAIAFNGYPHFANIARWIGNEKMIVPNDTWSTGSCDQGCANSTHPPPAGNPTSPDWCAAEAPSTLQTGDNWFYIENGPIHPVSDLVQYYLTILGRNSNWLLDVAPPPNSTVVQSHMANYQGLGDWVRGCFDASKVLGSGTIPAGSTSVTVNLATPAAVSIVVLREDQSQGQFVQSFNVTAVTSGGSSVPFPSKTPLHSIGARRILYTGGTGVQSVASLQVSVDTPTSGPAGIAVSAYFCTVP